MAAAKLLRAAAVKFNTRADTLEGEACDAAHVLGDVEPEDDEMDSVEAAAAASCAARHR